MTATEMPKEIAAFLKTLRRSSLSRKKAYLDTGFTLGKRGSNVEPFSWPARPNSGVPFNLSIAAEASRGRSAGSGKSIDAMASLSSGDAFAATSRSGGIGRANICFKRAIGVSASYGYRGAIFSYSTIPTEYTSHAGVGSTPSHASGGA